MNLIRRLLIVLLLSVVGAAFASSERTALPKLKQLQPGDDRGYAVMVRGVEWRVPKACLPWRSLGSDAGQRDLGSDAGQRDLGSDAGQRDLGSDAGQRDLGSDAGQRDLGSDAGQRDLGSDAGQRDLGSDAGQRDLGSDAGQRDLGSDAGQRDLGSAAELPLCRLGEREESVVLEGVSTREVRIPAGSRFTRVEFMMDGGIRLHL